MRVESRGLRRLLAGCVLTGLLLAAAPAGATLTGLSGLLTVPTADVLPQGGLEAGIHFVGEDGKESIDRLVAGFAMGAIENVEAGLTNLRKKGSWGEFELALKGLFLAETARNPGVAVGFEPSRAFVVASKRISPRLRVHAGYGYGEEDGLFGGASFALTTASAARSALRAPTITAMAEYTRAGVNVGARLVFSPTLSADVGILDLEGSNEWIAGVSYRRSF